MTTFTTQDRQDAQRTPLTDEQIKQIAKQEDWFIYENEELNIPMYEFARAIERAHGIGE
jgi:hypothetical protein